MKRVLAAFVLMGSVSSQAQQPPPPDRVCVPRVLLEQWAAYTAGRPWNEVAAVLERLRTEMQAPQPCPVPEPAKAP